MPAPNVWWPTQSKHCFNPSFHSTTYIFIHLTQSDFTQKFLSSFSRSLFFFSQPTDLARSVAYQARPRRSIRTSLLHKTHNKLLYSLSPFSLPILHDFKQRTKRREFISAISISVYWWSVGNPNPSSTHSSSSTLVFTVAKEHYTLATLYSPSSPSHWLLDPAAYWWSMGTALSLSVSHALVEVVLILNLLAWVWTSKTSFNNFIVRCSKNIMTESLLVFYYTLLLAK